MTDLPPPGTMRGELLTRPSVALRRATDQDADAILTVMAAAARADRNGVFVSNNLAFIRAHITVEGLVMLAHAGTEVVGFCIVRLPGMQTDNLGRDVGLQGDDLLAVAHIESVAVSPDHRGRGIQQALVLECERLLAHTPARSLMCTVSPRNFPSLRNFTQLGYRTAATALKYGGLTRLILLKDLPRTQLREVPHPR